MEFAQVVQRITDATGTEISKDSIWSAFDGEYLTATAPLHLVSYRLESGYGEDEGEDEIAAVVRYQGVERTIRGLGNGPIAAFCSALDGVLGYEPAVRDYHEHALTSGSRSMAAAYLEVDVAEEVTWGVAIHPNIVTASLRAITSAVNRATARRQAVDPEVAAGD